MTNFYRLIKCLLLAGLILSIIGTCQVIKKYYELTKNKYGYVYEHGYSDGYKTGKAADYKPVSPYNEEKQVAE